MNALPLPGFLLLDMDDTILADDAQSNECWWEVATRFAPRVGAPPPELRETIRAVSRWHWSDPERHRRGRLNLLATREYVVGEVLRRMGKDDGALAAEMAAVYSALRDERAAPFPGALEALQTLRERGLRMALLTNGQSSLQRRKIERFGLARFFDTIVIEGEFGCGKPDLRVFQHALAELGCAPAQAWMVGDNLEWDVAAPQRLGVFGVWHDYRRQGLPEDSQVRPDLVIHALGDLLAHGAEREPCSP